MDVATPTGPSALDTGVRRQRHHRDHIEIQQPGSTVGTTRIIHEKRYRYRDQCRRCTYDLTGLPEGRRCPECGLAEPESVSISFHIHKIEHSRSRLAVILATSLLATCMIGPVSRRTWDHLIATGLWGPHSRASEGFTFPFGVYAAVAVLTLLLFMATMTLGVSMLPWHLTRRAQVLSIMLALIGAFIANVLAIQLVWRMDRSQYLDSCVSLLLTLPFVMIGMLSGTTIASAFVQVRRLSKHQPTKE